MKDASRDLRAKFNVSPIKNIQEARCRLDYFAAFALSVAYIEHYAFIKHRRGLDKNAIKKLKGQSVSHIVKQLFHEDKDREELHRNIIKIIKERDSLVHPKDQIYNKYDYDVKREELLDLAIECITELMNFP